MLCQDSGFGPGRACFENMPTVWETVVSHRFELSWGLEASDQGPSLGVIEGSCLTHFFHTVPLVCRNIFRYVHSVLTVVMLGHCSCTAANQHVCSPWHVVGMRWHRKQGWASGMVTAGSPHSTATQEIDPDHDLQSRHLGILMQQQSCQHTRCAETVASAGATHSGCMALDQREYKFR